jgi:hypothetical protein
LMMLVVDDRNRLEVAAPDALDEGLLRGGQFRQGECRQGSP